MHSNHFSLGRKAASEMCCAKSGLHKRLLVQEDFSDDCRTMDMFLKMTALFRF